MDDGKIRLNETASARMEDTIDMGQWDDRQKLALACRMLAHEGHSETLAGQLTLRLGDGTFLTPPLGLGFEEVGVRDLLRIDDGLRVVEGKGMVNPATRFHLWIYRRRPEVNCIIHTHPPYVTALSMTNTPLKIAHMDATPFFEDCAFLPHWPGVPVSDEEGRIISAALGTKRTILLANHGFLAATGSIEESAYLSVLIERTARNQIRAQSIGEISTIDPRSAREAHDLLLSPGVVKATFALFARRALQREPEGLV